MNYTIESYGAESIEKANQIVIFEIWTNGGILPKEAICQALNYLRTLFTHLGEIQILDSLLTTYSLLENEDFQKTIEKFELKV